MTEKIEYDANLGGPIELPDLINTYNYAADRINEIQSLVTAINNPNQTKLIFQKLPKHMRRRAMSHNPKRLPRKYRQSQMAQMAKSGRPTASKRPSRKFRRKPSNLLKEYLRRQKKHVWLETHIWHAKRFHMVERWGYKLPSSSCDKTFRANYRATTKHCLIQDISYVGCIQLTGSVPFLRTNFERMRTPGFGLGLCAAAYITGRREGSIDLFKPDQYPLGALGKVNFMWKPNCDNSDIQTVWLFAHPSFYKDLLDELQELFQLKEQSDSADEHMEIDDGKEENPSPKTSLKLRKFKNDDNQVEMLELKDCLNRFRLTGPLSQAVLLNAFKCSRQTKANNPTWFGNFLTIDRNAEAHMAQSSYWSTTKSILSPAQLCPNMILALNVEDPRSVRPNKRTKSQSAATNEPNQQQNLNQSALNIPPLNGVSDLWNIETRQRILCEKMKTSEFCRMRSVHALVPGDRCAFEETLQPIPIVLIQRPGSQNPKFKQLGYGCGWDVIVPAGYGISTWIALIMWGARAGGLREMDSIYRESGSDEFLPDTSARKVIDENNAQQLRDKYFRLPPNKRPNFNKLSISSPFICPWKQLVQEWMSKPTGSPSTDFFVIRHRATLERLQASVQSKKMLAASDLPENCLIPIHLQMENRGTLAKNSIVCLPIKRDLKQDIKKRRNLNNEPVYTEPLADDKFEKERKTLRTNHLRLLKRLRRRRVRVKRRKQQTAVQRILIAKPQTAKLIAEQMIKMRELWLPEVPAIVRHQCSRQVIGYVTDGTFSFIESKSAGVAYITWNGFKCLLNASHYKGVGANRVLVRSPNTLKYRFATFKIKCDF